MMVITLLFVFGLVLVNYAENLILAYQQHYIENMYGIVQMSILSSNSLVGAFFMAIFPILAVLPTSTLNIVDRGTRVDVAYRIRASKARYMLASYVSVFVTTFLIFTIPFFVELLLEIFTFGLEANGSPVYANYYTFLDQCQSFFLMDIYFKNRILYAVIYILIFGMFSAVLALFNYSLTTLPFMKFRVMSFFPVYLVLYLLENIKVEINGYYKKPFDYVNTLRIFGSYDESVKCWVMVLAALIIVSVIMFIRKIASDEI